MSDDTSRWEIWKSIASLQIGLTGGMAAAVLIAPKLLLKLFGVAATPGTVLFFRAFGASLAFVAVAHQGLKDSRDPQAVRTVLLANVAEDLLLTMLSAQGVLRGTLGKAGWLLVGVFGSEVVMNGWLATKFAAGEASYAEGGS